MAEAPAEYENSWAYFRTLVLITVLQRDLGLRYNPAKVPDDAPFEPADVFIHGAIQGKGGTCASLPVVYAAIGPPARLPNQDRRGEETPVQPLGGAGRTIQYRGVR